MEQTLTNSTSPLRALSNQMADAVERISSSLVLVNGRQRQPASGIVYAANLVLTTDHVLEREEDLTIVTPDKRTLPAQFVGRDLATDLALLRITETLPNPATAAKENARVGQLVMAGGSTAPGGAMARSCIVSRRVGSLPPTSRTNPS